MSLTPALKKTLDFIKGYIKQNGISPSVREVAAGIGIRSKSSAHRHIQKLNQLGYLEQSPNEARSILVSPENGRIPIFGTIAAGSATEVFEKTGEWRPSDWVSFDHSIFALHVAGDSMSDAGIQDGDLVVCKASNIVSENQIAVVLVDNQEVTLKYCKKTNKGLKLIPANPSYQPKIYDFERIEIKGYVVMQMRQYG